MTQTPTVFVGFVAACLVIIPIPILAADTTMPRVEPIVATPGRPRDQSPHRGTGRRELWEIVAIGQL